MNRHNVKLVNHDKTGEHSLASLLTYVKGKVTSFDVIDTIVFNAGQSIHLELKSGVERTIPWPKAVPPPVGAQALRAA